MQLASYSRDNKAHLSSNHARGWIKGLMAIKDGHRVNKINIRKGLHLKRFTSKDTFSFLKKKSWNTKEVLCKAF